MSQNRIKKLDPNHSTSLKNLEIAQRDLKTTKSLYKNKYYDWTLITSYNAMLQASRAYMFNKGYRAKGPHKHMTTVHFMMCFEETFDQSTITLLDRIRKRRHSTLYDQPKTVSESEARRAITQAEKLVKKVKEELT